MEVRWSDESKINDVPAWIARLLNKPVLEFYCGARPLHGKERDQAVAEFKRVLRELIDQWLDSGKIENSGEEVQAAWERNITWTSNRYPTPLFKTLREFWNRHQKNTQVVIDGTHAAPLVSKVGVSDRTASRNARSAAREQATFEFSRLLDSPSPQRLFRCDECGEYFSKQRAPRKDTPIFNGSFCGKKECRLSGGAKRTEKKRQRELDQKLSLAVTLWIEYGERKRPKPCSVWIADRMTREHGILMHGKWVTQHKAEIQMRVQERRSHAKS